MDLSSGAHEESKGYNDEEPTDCVICLDKPETRGRLNSCDHLFCFSCVKKWSEQENTCPLCKKRFTQIEQHPAAVATEATSTRSSRKRKAPASSSSSSSGSDLGDGVVKRVVHVARRDQSQQRDEELAGRLHGYRSFLDSLYQDMEERSSGLGELSFLFRAAARTSVIHQALMRNRERQMMMRSRENEQLRSIRQRLSARRSWPSPPGRFTFFEGGGSSSGGGDRRSNNEEVVVVDDSDSDVEVLSVNPPPPAPPPASTDASSSASSSSSSSSSSFSSSAAPIDPFDPLDPFELDAFSLEPDAPSSSASSLASFAAPAPVDPFDWLLSSAVSSAPSSSSSSSPSL